MNKDKQFEILTFDFSARTALALREYLMFVMKNTARSSPEYDLLTDFIKSTEQKLVECEFLSKDDLELIHIIEEF